MVTYYGKRTVVGGPERVMVRADMGAGVVLTHPLLHRELHSPTGFQWGYGGSGPADLALSILLDHLGESPTQAQLERGQPVAWALHQAFKWDFVAGFGDEWELTSDRINHWLADPAQARASLAHLNLWDELGAIVARDAALAESGLDAEDLS